MRWPAAVSVLFCFVLGACSSDPTTSNEYAALEQELAEANQELAEANQELAEAETLFTEVAAELDAFIALKESIGEVEANETAYIEAWQAKDLDALMESMTEDILFVDETFGDYIEGSTDVRRMYGHVIRYADDNGHDVLDRLVSADGTLAASTWEWIGTNSNGLRFSLPTTLVHEYRDGKIVKETVYYASPNPRKQLLGSP